MFTPLHPASLGVSHHIKDGAQREQRGSDRHEPITRVGGVEPEMVRFVVGSVFVVVVMRCRIIYGITSMVDTIVEDRDGSEVLGGEGL